MNEDEGDDALADVIELGGQKPSDDAELLEGEEQPEAVLQALNSLESVVTLHIEWLKNWHLAVVSGLAAENRAALTPPVLTIPQWAHDPVLRSHPQHKRVDAMLVSLQKQAENLCDLVKASGSIPTREYSEFMNSVLTFASTIRQVQNDTWNQLVSVDPLTGLGNRRAMWRKLRIECERQARTRDPCCVAMLDLDLFKQVNDTWGHTAGDLVLRNVATALRASVRPYDAVFRFGGDEFLLCLPNADLRAAWAIIERLRLKISCSRAQIRPNEGLAATLSVGIAPLEHESGVETALERADAALYTAKRNGRNCVYAWRNQAR